MGSLVLPQGDGPQPSDPPATSPAGPGPARAAVGGPQLVPYPVRVAILAALYFAAGCLGLSLATMHANVSLIWPPTGLALAALLLFGYHLWPGLALGAFLVNAATPVPLATAAGIAAGNTLEALAGAYLLRRVVGFDNGLGRIRDVISLVALAAVTSTTVSATIGVLSLCLGAAAPWALFGNLWWQWWLGDAMGALVVAPVLLTWGTSRRLNWSLRRTGEACILVALLTAVGHVVFSGWLAPEIPGYPLAFAVFPFVIWAALRFDPRGAAVATLLVSFLATWGQARGLGPFHGETLTERLLLLQTFMSVVAVTGLVLAAAMVQRRRVEESLLQLAEISALRVSEARFRGLLESAPDAIVIVDTQGCIVLVNAEVERMFQYGREELMGRPVEILVPHRLQARHGAHRADYTANPRTRPMGMGLALYGRRKDGSEFPVDITLSPLETPEGLLITGVVRDVTERKKAEEEHIQLIREQAARAEAEAALREKEILLKEVHHRVKNNLQIISSLLNLQAGAVRDKRTVAALTDMRHRVQTMSLIHEHLYRSSGLARIDVAEYLRALAARLFEAYGAAPRGIGLVLSVDPVPLGLDAAVPCGLIAAELVANALKHAFPGDRSGEIRIEVQAQQGQYLILRVADNGVGLPPGLDVSGAGTLGLQLVDALCRQIGGTLDVDRRGGAAFTLRFPVPGP